MKYLKITLILLLFIGHSCSEDSFDDNNSNVTSPFTVIEYFSIDVQKSYSKPVFTHYMPWFESPEFAEYPNTQMGNWGIHWTMSNKNPENIDANGKREIASHYYPLIEPYDNGEDDYLEYAVICMKLTGLDGILIDYAGITEVNDWKLLHDHTLAIIPWLEKAGLEFGIVYEDSALKNAFEQSLITDKVIEGKRVMHYMDNNFFSKSNYLKINNKPLLMNFGPQALFTDADWNTIFLDIQDINFATLPYTIDNYSLNTSTNGEFVWVGETVDEIFYQHCSQYDIVVGGAMPEFKDYYLEGDWGNGYTDYDGMNGLLFDQTLQRSNNYDIDLLQIITWNDYGEGTIIEPTLEFGYSRLEQIQSFLGVSYRSDDLSLAVKLYQKRKEHKGKVLENKKLDQIFFYLISLQIEKAKTLLNEI
tara:strand:+ start:356 stop:1609 length:1254 start_codon:yes stop_codon:yes gene_type:complete